MQVNLFEVGLTPMQMQRLDPQGRLKPMPLAVMTHSARDQCFERPRVYVTVMLLVTLTLMMLP